MKRDGKKLRTLAPGDRRRLSDARNAWRKMTQEQRLEFLCWITDFHQEVMWPLKKGIAADVFARAHLKLPEGYQR